MWILVCARKALCGLHQSKEHVKNIEMGADRHLRAHFNRSDFHFGD